MVSDLRRDTYWARGQDSRTAKPLPQQPNFLRLLGLDLGLWAAAAAPPAPLSQKGRLPGLTFIISKSSRLFGSLIKAQLRLHTPPPTHFLMLRALHNPSFLCSVAFEITLHEQLSVSVSSR